MLSRVGQYDAFDQVMLDYSFKLFFKNFCCVEQRFLFKTLINKFCITHAYKVLQFKKYKSNEYSHSFEEKTVYVP